MYYVLCTSIYINIANTRANICALITQSTSNKYINDKKNSILYSSSLETQLRLKRSFKQTRTFLVLKSSSIKFRGKTVQDTKPNQTKPNIQTNRDYYFINIDNLHFCLIVFRARTTVYAPDYDYFKINIFMIFILSTKDG